jgi:hypothetical protein
MYKYQLIFLGNTAAKAAEQIRSRFFAIIKEMGMEEDSFAVLTRDSFGEYSNKQPTFAYYFGNINSPRTDVNEVQQLINNGDAIFPIYFEKDSFHKEVPSLLYPMNGRFYDGSKVDRYVNCALESLRLIRNNRKLFVSYRRTDSVLVANQLFDALLRNNYEVFLDTYSIIPAVNFQDELAHRLTDCDVLIQLFSPHFKESEWCAKEIVLANQKQIGIVEIVWPGMKLEAYNQLTNPIILQGDDFVDGNHKDEKASLTDDAIKRIVNEVESVRARNLAARQDNLIGEFVNEAKKVGKTLVREYRYLLENLSDAGLRLYLPAIGVPQSYDCFKSRAMRALLERDDIQLYLLYDNVRIKRDWIDHLDWLNESLEVKTIKKQDFELWLKNN